MQLEQFMGIAARRQPELYSWVLKKRADAPGGQRFDGRIVEWRLSAAQIRDEVANPEFAVQTQQFIQSKEQIALERLP